MQIKRVKEIKNIGTFSDFTNGGSISFEKLTFVYGFNTFGKTTLSDVFQSLKDNNCSVILERKTIPEIASGQKVTLSVQENERGENDVIFDGTQWSTNNISSYLEIFGTDFIHKNVFTGLTFERNNKENLTNFILGDQGVQLAETIKRNKQVLGEKKRNLKEKIPQHVKTLSESEINRFIAYNVSDLELNKVDIQLTDKKNLLKREEERLKEPTKITKLSEPELFKPETNNLEDKFTNLNTLLKKTYANIKEESIERLNKHVLTNFTSTDNSRNWIKQGLDCCKHKHEGNCPFCGQHLNNVKELIDLYDSYFDEEYTNFIDKIATGLKTNLDSLKTSRLSNQSRFQTSLLKINQYKNLIADTDFQENLRVFESNVSTLKEEEIENEKKKIILEMENKIDEKIKSPYEEIAPINLTNFSTVFKEYEDQIAKLPVSIELFIEKIRILKQKYQNTKTIEETVNNLKGEVKNIEYIKARIKQNEECSNYKKMSKKIKEMEDGENGIKALELRLQNEQTTFLEKYFQSINQLFSTFGSKNFTLKKNEDSRGHMPVYSLKVKFHNKEIPTDKICTVFSESDRRALALAIFFARIELKEKNEKSKTVIILDDPITSFDDNRVTKSVNYFKDIINKCNQVIILTHYMNFIKRFCEITKKQQLTIKFINITQNNLTSLLSLGNRNEFTSSAYEKVFMEIYGFINKSHNNSIKHSLRPFLEDMYLPTVFSKRIHDNNIDCNTLESMIDGIFEDNETVKNKFHEFRTTLNPDSHTFTDSNSEDVRNFADDMFTYLYSINITP